MIDESKYKYVTIFSHGAMWLEDKMMFQGKDREPKKIQRVTPYKYKKCRIHFFGGTSEFRDFDETFCVMVEDTDGERKDSCATR